MEEGKLDNFVKKLMALQAEKDREESLSEEDLQYIAQGLGIAIEDLEQSRKDYLSRAEGHLKYKNWQDAAQEFEQLVVLDPRNARAYLGLAKSYAGLWEQTQKKDWQEKALRNAEKSIDINPQNQEAYALISRLKKPAKKTRPKEAFHPRRTRKKRLSLRSIWLLGVWAAFFIGIHSIINSNNDDNDDNEQNEQISDFISQMLPKNVTDYHSVAAINEDGAVFWSFEYEQRHETNRLVRDFFVRIINPKNGKEVKKIYFEKAAKITNYYWRNVELINGLFYNYNSQNKTFEARDIQSGEVKLNPEILAQKHPELKIGIGEVNKSQDIYKLTLKNADVYWFSPYDNTVVDDKVYQQQKREQYKQRETIYQWHHAEEGQKKRFYLFRKEERKRVRSQWQRRHGRKINPERGFNYRLLGQLISSAESPWFINAEILYGDENICVIWHQDEIGANASNIISAIDKNGKLIWQNQDNSKYLLKYLQKSEVDRAESIRSNEELVVHFPYLRIEDKNYRIAVGINLKNGKILWEYSPTLKQ